MDKTPLTKFELAMIGPNPRRIVDGHIVDEEGDEEPTESTRGEA